MTRRGLVLFALMSVIWGIPYLFIRIAVAEIQPAVLVLVRTALGAAILLLSPVLLLVALAIRLDSPGPILFRQPRHGYNHRPVEVWKFRSMYARDCDPARAATEEQPGSSSSSWLQVARPPGTTAAGAGDDSAAGSSGSRGVVQRSQSVAPVA